MLTHAPQEADRTEEKRPHPPPQSDRQRPRPPPRPHGTRARKPKAPRPARPPVSPLRPSSCVRPPPRHGLLSLPRTSPPDAHHRNLMRRAHAAGPLGTASRNRRHCSPAVQTRRRACCATPGMVGRHPRRTDPRDVPRGTTAGARRGRSPDGTTGGGDRAWPRRRPAPRSARRPGRLGVRSGRPRWVVPQRREHSRGPRIAGHLPRTPERARPGVCRASRGPCQETAESSRGSGRPRTPAARSGGPP